MGTYFFNVFGIFGWRSKGKCDVKYGYFSGFYCSWIDKTKDFCKFVGVKV